MEGAAHFTKCRNFGFNLQGIWPLVRISNLYKSLLSETFVSASNGNRSVIISIIITFEILIINLYFQQLKPIYKKFNKLQRTFFSQIILSSITQKILIRNSTL